LLSNLFPPVATQSLSLDDLLFPPLEYQPRLKAAVDGAPGRRSAGPSVAVSDGPPLPSITGAEVSKGVLVSGGWLDATMSLEGARKVESVGTYGELVALARMLVAVNMGVRQSEFESAGRQREGYRDYLVGPLQTSIWYGHPERLDVHIRLPGKACEMMGWDSWLSLVRALTKRGAKFSRLDDALDDYNRTIEPEEMYQIMLENKAVVSHADWFQLTNPRSRRAGNSRGVGLYIGSPESRQRSRHYCKFLESKGKINAVRHEHQLRDEAAQSLALQLTACGDNWSEVIRGRFVNFVDFRQGEGSHYERRPRCEWWESIVGDAVKVGAYGPVALKSVVQLWGTFRHQYKKMLHVFLTWFGGDLEPLFDMAREGGHNLSARHERLLSEIRSLMVDSYENQGKEWKHGKPDAIPA
jgi:hypothetical protein